MAEVLKGRQDAFLFFCVSFKPLMPLVNGLMNIAGGSREVALVKALVDPASFETLSGRAGVAADGLFVDLTLTLQKGHQNRLFHFLRMPAIERGSLEFVPAGAAAFVTAGLGDSAARYQAARPETGEGPAPIAALDLLREVFANIVSCSVFVLPPGERAGGDGLPIPDLGLALTVHDPAKSQALWTQILGIASLATGGGALEGTSRQVAGTAVRSFAFPRQVTVHTASVGSTLVLASSETAMARALEARQSGRSIGTDAAFSHGLARVGEHTTLALFCHPGRCAQVAKLYMDADDIAEAQPIIDAMTETVGSIVVSHSGDTFHWSGRVTGLPNVGPVLAGMLAAQETRELAP